MLKGMDDKAKDLKVKGGEILSIRSTLKLMQVETYNVQQRLN